MSRVIKFLIIVFGDHSVGNPLSTLAHKGKLDCFQRKNSILDEGLITNNFYHYLFKIKLNIEN